MRVCERCGRELQEGGAAAIDLLVSDFTPGSGGPVDKSVELCKRCARDGWKVLTAWVRSHVSHARRKR